MQYTIENINEIQDLEFEYGNPSKILYKTDSFEYNLLVILNNKFDNLLVLSNGAVDYQKKMPPIFMRSKWARELDANLIYLDDPTIHSSGLNLGWGQGNENEFVLKIYCELVKAVSENLEIEAEKVCYFGSSAGGFMSMLLSTMHEHSFAIVNNPQTDVRNYHEGHSTPLLQLSYGSVENATEKYKERINVCAAFEKYKRVPKIYYLQNHFSNHDLKFHVNPFLKDLRDMGLAIENITLIYYYNRERGHTPLDKESALKSINLLMKNDLM